jgi:hypothetical protein
MEQTVVRKLETEIERSGAEVVCRLEFRHLLLLPSQQTMHFMAKEAVMVYETAVGNHQESRRD